VTTVQQPDSDWIVREDRVATQAPDLPAEVVADGGTVAGDSESIVETGAGRGLVQRRPRYGVPNRSGVPQVSSAETVVRRVPSYDYRAVRVVRYVAGIVEVLLMIRFFLKLLGASPDAAFTILIYGVTYLLVIPFQDIFAHPSHGAFVFDSSALVAALVYPLLAGAITGLIRIKTARRSPWDTQ
jgi:hypothetical protein